MLSHAFPSIFCSTFHHFFHLSLTFPFGKSSAVDRCLADLLVDVDWDVLTRQVIKGALSGCGFDVENGENGENDEENIGKLELCHYAVQT